MPNIKSAKKRVKVNEAKAGRNKAVKTNLKTVLKKAGAAVSSGSDDSREAVLAAVKKLDRAAAKGLIHKNNAARKKSKLTKKLNKAG